MEHFIEHPIIDNIFWVFDFKILYFLKMCPIFVGSTNNFGRRDDDMIKWKVDDFQ